MKTKDGTPIAAFDLYCAKNADYAATSQKRYAEVASRFIDYLWEARVFDRAVRPNYLNSVIEAYPTLLRDGSAATAARIGQTDDYAWLADVANALEWPPLAPNSLDNAIAAVNRFLRLSESLAREAHEKAILLGASANSNLQSVIRILEGTVALSSLEVTAMKQNTMFGNVAKYAPKGIQRPRGLRKPGVSSKATRKVLDFPRKHFPSLISAACTWRDKSLWLLLGAVGIRISEALNLLVEDIDMEEQRIYVFDPNARRPQLDASSPNRLRFKGREMAYTYAIPELRNDLFFALTQYLNYEFVPLTRSGHPRYLFQYIDPLRRGQPLVDCSYSALTQNFRRATHAAGVPVPRDGLEWVPHSLRHMYGVYMANDLPINPALGQFGLPLVDVQMMIGHATLSATAHYSRRKHRRLAQKLEASDMALLGLSREEIAALPSFNLRLQVPA